MPEPFAANGPTVWLGTPFFSEHLRALGHDLRFRYLRPGDVYRWEDILDLTGGTAPGLVVYADVSLSPPLVGVERYPCLTAFYAVDSHIHSWYPMYAQGFDLCLASIREHMPRFASGRLDASRVWWTPPHARDHERPPAHAPEKEWDLLFVGTMNPELSPERCAFLNAVRERVPGFHAQSGAFAELFPRARLALNECRAGELNFRIFEALGMGTCLLTPDTGPPLTDLFTDGEHLFFYPDRDAAALADLARRLLAKPALYERAARAGLAEVDAKHRASVRAKEFAERIDALVVQGLAERFVRERLAVAPVLHREALRLFWLHHAETTPHDGCRAAYLAEARACDHVHMMK